MTSILKLIFQDSKSHWSILVNNSKLIFRYIGITVVVLFAHFAGQAQGNQKPKIEGQQPLYTNEEQAITIQLAHLYVNDKDDWWYPWGFSLTVYPGTNYSVSGTTITPAVNFTGVLVATVTVNDGEEDSPPYNLQITVNPINDAPVITGQGAITTNPTVPVTIQLSHLTVSDPDNTYPNGFGLTVYPGNNYTVLGNQVTPVAGFTGTLTVPVTVNDGIAASEQFGLKILVNSSIPEIVGQEVISINEDEPLVIAFSHLKVADGDNAYPNGFTIGVQNGTNYSFEGTTVQPAPDFTGNLTVVVTVSDGQNTSKPYNLIVTVMPVNDAPRILNFESEPLGYAVTKGPVTITNLGEVSDPDTDSLMVAEIGFRPEFYRSGEDEFLFENTANIKGAFDSRVGVLALFGKASVAEYTQAIRSLKYLSYSTDAASFGTRKFYINVSDGIATSETLERIIKAGEFIAALDIPNGFTPNGDFANDTWKIKPLKNNDDYSRAVVRVYTKSGKLVYENTGFVDEWDGRYNGDVLPADVYFYTIDLNVAYTRSSFKGIVSILR
jgi:gliding motility-associated-like protein